MAHETLEAFKSTFLPDSMSWQDAFDISHAYANQFFGSASNPGGVSECYVCNPPFNLIQWNFPRVGINVSAKTMVRTPAPDANLHGGYAPGKIVQVKKAD